MQTFLPSPNFWAALSSLDTRRLGQQRAEAYQIWRIVSGSDMKSPWKQHPAVRMWYGHDEVLKLYILVACRLFQQRGGKNELMAEHIWRDRLDIIDHARLAQQYPSWLSGTAGRVFTGSHRAQLFRKDHKEYARFWPFMALHIGYWWPIPKMEKARGKRSLDCLVNHSQVHEADIVSGKRRFREGMSLNPLY